MSELVCPYCGVGCSIKVYEGFKLKGRLCKKPLKIPEALYKGRLETPFYRKGNSFKAVDWETAYTILKEKLTELSPEEIFFYLSGQLTTEAIYVVNKFAKGFLKTNNVDSNSRLCVSSSAVAYKMVFGSDGPPCCYDDIESGEVFFIIGANPAVSFPMLFRRILNRRLKAKNTFIVTVDPLETETARKSDVHIPIKAGTDTVFLNAVLYLLYKKGRVNWEFINKHTIGFEKALAEALKFPPSVASKICGVTQKDINLVADLFSSKRKLISLWCLGLNQSFNGTMKVISLLNLHLATGKLNEKGCPFSLTGQSNSMGGREVGYTPFGLPGFRNVEIEEDRKFMEEFWDIEGIKPCKGPTILSAIDLILEGKIKLLWVICTNPAISLPNLNKVRKALREVFLVVQDAYWNDTAKFADLILPACQVGEREGFKTSMDRKISFSHKVWKAPPCAKPDWLIFTELARKMGGEKLFPYKSSLQIFEEFSLTTQGRICDISRFNSFPLQWGGRWLYEDLIFKTPSGKAEFYPAEFYTSEADGEFILITGRVADQWHSMTRTGKSKSLLKSALPPFVIMNPEDALQKGIEEWDRVRITSKNGWTERFVRYGKIVKGHLFTPFGYPDEFGPPVNFLTSDRYDPFSEEPDLKYTCVRVEKI